MNCERYRERLMDGLASGADSLDGGIAGHLRICVECRKFYEAQVNLFGAIDAGVRTMMNETVPVSLLPGVRARVAEIGAPQRSWKVAWRFAAVGIAAAMVIGVGLLRQGSEKTNRVTARVPALTQGVREMAPASVPRAQSQAGAVAPKRRQLEVKRVAVPEDGEAKPEVLVLAEERAAFARFVSDLPKDRDVAVALTRQVAETGDKAVEIALLRIDELDVKPLESSNQ